MSVSTVTPIRAIISSAKRQSSKTRLLLNARTVAKNTSGAPTKAWGVPSDRDGCPVLSMVTSQSAIHVRTDCYNIYRE